jgi:hypothetical protein
MSRIKIVLIAGLFVIAASIMNVAPQANYKEHLSIPVANTTSHKSGMNLSTLSAPLFNINVQPTFSGTNTLSPTALITTNVAIAPIRTTYKPISAAPPLFLTKSERDKIERVVMASCGELDNPLMAEANAQVILDRTASGRFGKGINAVLNAPGQFEKPWKGGVNSMVINAVSKVFDNGKRVTAKQIYYYINPNICEISLATWKKDKSYVATFGRGKYIHQYWTTKH